jgi:Fic-DOC domain mobile mystery protein B
MTREDVFSEPDDAATPLTAEERRDLIPAYITFKRDLNEAEQANIARGQEWALRRTRTDILTEKFILGLHKQMLKDVWKWAGKFRRTERNIGIDWWLIQTHLRTLLDDAKAWIEYKTFPPDEIAVRFHHRLVAPGRPALYLGHIESARRN